MFTKAYFNSLPSWEESFKAAAKPVFVYGTGDGCLKVLDELERRGIKCEGIFASDGFVRDREFAGYKVRSLAEVEQEHSDFTVAVAFGSSLPEVMEQIDRVSQQHLTLFPDVPVIGEEVFDKGGFLERFEQAERVYSLLADEQSRRVFEGVLAFKITGDTSYLRPCFTDPGEAYSGILKLSDNEIYVDAGAYTGDTVAEFVKAAGKSYRMIYAAEPNRKNFRKCLKNTLELDNIRLYNCPVWSHDCMVRFTSGAGRQQKVSDMGAQSWARSVDSILGGGEATYIKYDVEGADRRAIEGSRETIQRYSPKICTALYHRAYDILDIPLLINSLNGGYRLYMRQYPYYPAWETNLFAVQP